MATGANPVNPYPVDWQRMSPDELLQVLMQQSGSIPGKTPAARLNFLQDEFSSVGGNLFDQLGSPDTQAAPPSLQRTAWGSNPIYSDIFDRIDAGADPVSAVAAVQKANPKALNWADSNATGSIKKAATDYAYEHAKDIQDKASGSGAYTPKKGQAPALGQGMFDSSSEESLLGNPTADDLINQLVASKGIKRSVNTHGARQKALSFDEWAAGQGGVAAGAPVSGNTDTGAMTPGYASSSRLPRSPATTSAAQSSVDVNPETGLPWSDAGSTSDLGTDPTKLLGDNFTNGSIKSSNRQNADKQKAYQKYLASNNTLINKNGLIGGDAQTDTAYRDAAKRRIDQARSTMVRSQAGTDALAKILAMRTMLGS